MNVPTLNSTLNEMQERECSWYEECSYEYDTRETQGVFGGGYCVKALIIVDGFDLGYNIRFEKLVREACVAITGREESATAIWPVSNRSAA